jgi:hypothetical protein
VKKHTDAIAALIRTIPTLAAKTYVTLAVNADKSPVTLPYVVIHPADGTDQSDRLTGPATAQHPRFTIHGVGLTYDQASWVGEQIKSKLIVGGFGVTPTVPGERAGMVWYSVPQPVQADTDASPPYCYHTAECGFESSPA